MIDRPAWLARSRPMSGAVSVSIHRCGACGRELYMLLSRADWNKVFCRGCDEEQGQCYCPSSREVVA